MQVDAHIDAYPPRNTRERCSRKAQLRGNNGNSHALTRLKKLVHSSRFAIQLLVMGSKPVAD
jgi:hypothetical protein